MDLDCPAALAPCLQSPLAGLMTDSGADSSFAQGCTPLVPPLLLPGGRLVLLPPGSYFTVLGTLSVMSSLAWGALAYSGDGRKERLRI